MNDLVDRGLAWSARRADRVEPERADVLIIGGGQAGLATAFLLKKAGISFRVIEKHVRIGDSWRKRYDSMVLFTSRRFSQLPGLAIPGDPDGYPTKDEIADYLESYASHHRIAVTVGTGVDRLAKEGSAFRAELSNGSALHARAVVVATGAFQTPVVPDLSSGLAPGVVQLTAAGYRNPTQLPSGTVVVAGDGATGRQIALDLAGTHRVLLAIGKPRHVLPQRLLGMDIFWWMKKLGLYQASTRSWIGRRLRERDPFPGKHLELDALREAGIQVRGRVTHAGDRMVRFSSGESTDVDAVIWAVGYRDDHAWMKIDGAISTASGKLIEDRGVSPVPGLFTVGRSWQSSRGSALIGGVAVDAAHIVRHMLRMFAEV